MHRDRVRAEVRDGDVRPAVTAQVLDGTGDGCPSRHDDGLRTERAAAVSEKHRDRFGVLVHNGEVQQPVAAQVSEGDGKWTTSGREVGLLPEAAIAVSEKH